MTDIDPEKHVAAGRTPADDVRILLVAARASLVGPVRAALKADSAMRLRLCTEVRDAGGIAAEWRPDAVLLDEALAPRIGQRLIERLRADPGTRDAAVVVLGDVSAERTQTAVERIGADGSTPPPSPPALARALRCAIAERRARPPAATGDLA